jgi:aryl-alcohol dehydrogenase-like predicted oxidoreductase
MFRRDIETEILPYAASHDIGVLVYGPLAHGLLSGGMTPRTTFPSDDWRSHNPDFSGERLARNLEVVDRLGAFAREHGMSLPQLAVAWTLANPAVQVSIVGARHPAHLEATAAAGQLELSAEDKTKVDEILSDAVPVTGPNPEGM